MAAFNKFNCFVADLANKVHNLGSDSIQAMLSNVAPTATETVFSNLTEIAAGNGYTAGGAAMSLTSSSQTAGLYKGIFGAVSWTASGGTIGPFRYIAVYNNTAAGKNLIGWFDYGSSITLNAGDSFTFTPDATNGLLELQ